MFQSVLFKVILQVIPIIRILRKKIVRQGVNNLMWHLRETLSLSKATIL